MATENAVQTVGEPNRRKFLKTGIGAVASVTALSGCISTANSGATGDSQSTTDSPGFVTEGLKFTGVLDTVQQTDTSLIVESEATNVSGGVIEYAQVEFAFMGEEESRIGTGVANTSSLQPGVTWNFRIAYTGYETVANIKMLKIVTE